MSSAYDSGNSVMERVSIATLSGTWMRMTLWFLGGFAKIALHQHFQKGARVCLRSVDDPQASGVPAPTVKHGARRVKDGVTRVCNSTGDHLHRQAEVEFVQKIFNPPRPEFGPRNLKEVSLLSSRCGLLIHSRAFLDHPKHIQP